MTPNHPDHESLRELLDAACNDALTDEQFDRLEAALASSADARREYLRYFTLTGEIRYLVSLGQADLGFAEPPAVISLPQPAAPLPGGLFHGATDSIAWDWARSYLLAAVALGLFLLVAAFIPASWSGSNQSEQVARHTSESPAREPAREFVGQITGTASVKWSDDPNYLPPLSVNVRLGRQYKLKSGLMEITYNTGAKVILEGPCDYTAESTAGGYLALGKLTAKVESGEWRVESDNSRRLTASGNNTEVAQTPEAVSLRLLSKSPLAPAPHPSPPAPLFSVRTPTAVVTDLGTEFGIEVEDDGDMKTHVFQGAVELKIVDKAQVGNQTTRIVAGEAVRLQQEDKGGVLNVVFCPADFTAFAVPPGQLLAFAKEKQLEAFRRWSGFSNEIRQRADMVAYYDFQRDAAEPGVLRNRASTGQPLDGRIKGAVWCKGRFSGKQALYFHGRNCGNRVELPEQERFQFTGPFSVAVWFKVERFDGKWVALAAKGDTSWRLQQHEDTGAVSFGTDLDFGSTSRTTTTAGRTPVADGRWHLAVAVYEPDAEAAHVRLYLDGCLEADNLLTQPVALRQNNSPVWLGDNCARLEPSREFRGLIDEAAFFAAPLSAEEIAEMFQAGEPDRPNADGERR